MTCLDGPGDDRDEGSDDAPDAVALDIADAVESLTNLWSVAAQQAALRLSTHQLRALLVLEAATELNLTSLAERLGTGLPTASRLCDRLEAAGMLERSLHPEKRREVRLSLTTQGRRVLDDVAARRARALAAVLTGMDPADRSALRRVMRAFLAARSDGEHPPEAP
ncbi:MarR family winged helix-turn-helix transcriptional regulator [Streptomyces sp. YIM B13518]|uniref:MarR family winged helix-turn-helix transcriptional regulator n=1 Tax=Streptomyces sp. YIM B13518 TaxID=3366316 RepID=UPI0036AF7BA7